MLTVLSILFGIALGFNGGTDFILILWGIVGGVLGYLSLNKKWAILNGFFYGFFLIFSFMVGGYSGNSPLITRIPPFSILGIVGGLCGLLSGLAGLLIKKYILKDTLYNKAPWFQHKKYGYGWGLPATWQGWIVLLGYIIFIGYNFIKIDNLSHSASDTIISFISQIILASVILFFIVRITSGKPKWRWKDKEK